MVYHASHLRYGSCLLCKEDQEAMFFSCLCEGRQRLPKKVLLEIWGIIVFSDVAYAVEYVTLVFCFFCYDYYRLNCILGCSKLSPRNINLYIVILFMSRNFENSNKACSECNSLVFVEFHYYWKQALGDKQGWLVIGRFLVLLARAGKCYKMWTN